MTSRRDFLKVCGAGAASVLTALLGKHGNAENVQDGPDIVVDWRAGVDWAAGKDETAVFPGLDAYIRTGFEDSGDTMAGIKVYYEDDESRWFPAIVGVNEPAEIIDMWLEDGRDMFIYTTESKYWYCPGCYDRLDQVWWYGENAGEIRLKHLESLRGRLALFQALWSQHIERSAEVGREIEELSRLLDRVVKENWT